MTADCIYCQDDRHCKNRRRVGYTCPYIKAGRPNCPVYEGVPDHD